ncbi:MAG: CPBP family intramembrane metalloprotease [Chloroflexi bacterium]|nr:CPBP family intramembrane metalloprotease [Chloroflexota bacterium]
MSAEDAVITLVAVVMLAVIVVAANYADRHRSGQMQRAVYGTLILINLLILVTYGLAPSALDENDGIGESEALGALALAVIVAALASAVLLRRVRQVLMPLFPRFRGDPGQARTAAPRVSDPPAPAALAPDPEGAPLFPQMLNYYTERSAPPTRPVEAGAVAAPVQDAARDYLRGFNPDSTVHTVALVYVIYLLGTQLINFVLGGGLEGVAESFAVGLSAWDLLLNALPQVVIPLLGVGLGLRRAWPQIMRRLGLMRPTLEGIAVSFAVTIGLFIFVTAVSAIWQGLVSAETFEEQTEASNALAESVDTLGLAFLLAATAAVGEEIAFRGALQPVFGFWPTAILFALTHMQYTLTPAALIIFGVAIVFGWIRQRFSTTMAIFTHFFYNFIPLALTVALPEEAFALTLGLF